MEITETVTEFLVRRLKEAGAGRFEDIATATGVKVSFIRKFAYGSRENPRVGTIQPLIDFFAREDAAKTERAVA